ncbi:MAG: hypothetical protein ABSD27_12165 [Bryobacteraceae bacterium]
MRRVIAAAVVCLALAPSAWLAWRSRDLPHLGYLHDDALYWVSAKSIAEGRGYRIASLPDEPFETKYPPLYPLLLAGVWRLNPAFPENLPLAALTAWLMAPLYVAAARLAFLDLGVSRGHALALCAVVAVNPFLALCGISLLSELPFSVLLMLALGLIERARRPQAPWWLAAAAGAVASAAWLTRSVGGLLIVAGPLAFLLRRQPRRALAFAAAMAPGIAGWLLWRQVHGSPVLDNSASYYTDYLGYYLRTASLGDLPIIFWRNLDSLLSSLGGMLVFGLGDGPAGRGLAWVLAAAMLAGTWRAARQNGLASHHLFTAAYLGLLVVWNFMPDQRFLLPVYPVLLAGFFSELLNLLRRIRSSWHQHALGRVSALAAWACLAALALAALWQTGRAFATVLPGFVGRERAALAGARPAYEWIRQRLPPDAAVLAYRDPVLYLYTGRRACRLVIPPTLLYRGDRGAILRLCASAADLARAKRLTHALFTGADFNAELAGADRAAAEQAARDDARFSSLYERSGVSVRRLE